MKRMRVFVIVAIAAAFALAFAGCDDGSGSTNPPKFNVDFEMVLVPAGSFQRDTDPANISVITKPFYMQTTIVTQKQWKTVWGLDELILNDWSMGQENATDNLVGGAFMGDNYPINDVNWYRAIAYCNKLSALEGKTPVYTVSGVTDWANLALSSVPGTPWKDDNKRDAAWDAATADWDADGYRLPTEQERYWAAIGADSRGGVDITGYLKAYAGSSEGFKGEDDMGLYAYFLPEGPGEVATKRVNELGLYDMSGNQAEWCWDWFDGVFGSQCEGVASLAAKGTLTDYRGPAAGSDIPLDDPIAGNTFRVVADAGWDMAAYSPWQMQPGYRNGGNPAATWDQFSFRIVRNAE